jgi:hypothetical protein
MVMPNLFIVGAAKSGTSSFCNYLGQHPQIYMSAVKEPHYFSYEEKVDYSCGPGDKKRMGDSVGNLNDYVALFKGAEEYLVRGEGSTTYLDSLTAPGRIKDSVPEAKIIIILRNPVERAYASYMHLRRDGAERCTDFLQALREEDNRIRLKWSPLWHYKTRQFTYEKIKRYFDVFERNKIKIYIYDDWKNDNRNVLEDVFRFLEVDHKFSPDLSTKANVGAIPKYNIIHTFFVRQNIIKNLLKPLLPTSMRLKMREKLMKLNFERQPLSLDIRKELIEYYREDILKTQKLIEKNLAYWLD